MSRILDFTKRTLGRGKSGALTDTELSVIGYIVDRSKHGEVTHRDVAAWFSLRAAQVEELLRQMEERGLVTLTGTGKMHMQWTVALTAKALDIYQQALSRIWQLDSAAYGEQPPAAVLDLASLLGLPEPTEGTTV